MELRLSIANLIMSVMLFRSVGSSDGPCRQEYGYK